MESNNILVSGGMSRIDIINAIIEGHMKIHPYIESNLTGIGYNLSSTEFVLSTRKGILEKVWESNGERFVYVSPNDTILTYTKEYIEVDGTLAGTFHSKVSRVCQGLGHVNTTLDPTWRGQLILAINNPTSKQIRLVLNSPGNLSTMLVYKLVTPIAKGEIAHDNNQGRIDILLSYLYRPKLPRQLFNRSNEKLKEFITCKYSKSINGEDSYVNPEDSSDGESYPLFKLKEKLKNDLRGIENRTYECGPGGCYRPVINDEISLIQNCILFQIIIRQHIVDNDFMSFLIKGCHVKNLYDHDNRTIYMINKLIQIIDYEIDSINHTRRVSAQNKEIIKYTNEFSIKRNILNFIQFFISCSLLLFIAFFYISKYPNTISDPFQWLTRPITTALTTTIVVALFRQLLNSLRKFWKKI